MIAKSSFMRQPRTGQRRFCILMQFSLHPKRTFSPFLAQLTRAPSSHQAVGYDAVSRNASPAMQAGLNFQTQLILHFLKKTVSMGKISLETFWTFFWRKSWNLPQKLFFKAWSFQNLRVSLASLYAAVPFFTRYQLLLSSLSNQLTLLFYEIFLKLQLLEQDRFSKLDIWYNKVRHSN